MCNNNIKDLDIKCFECIYNNNFKKWIPLNPVQIQSSFKNKTIAVTLSVDPSFIAFSANFFE